MKYKVFLYSILAYIVLLSSANSQTMSDLALHRRTIFSPSTYKLTKQYTNSNWGTQLFVYAKASNLQYVTQDPYAEHDQWISSTTFHLDQNWNRMIYEEYGTNWVRAYGEQGDGIGQFSFPKSFDVVSYCDPFMHFIWYSIYIADTGNDRLVKLRYYFETEEIIWEYASENYGNFTHLSDVNVYNGGTHAWPGDDYILVLDNHGIRRLNEDGTQNAPTYGTFGCEGNIGEFCHPRAIVCGRSFLPSEPYMDPNADNNYAYVADAGNQRIVWLDINYVPGMNPWCTWLGEISTAGYDIVDLEVDSYGHVWAVDQDNGRLLKYTYDLFPLCQYGTNGSGPHQFYKPNNASCAGGYWGAGNIMTTESWSDTSGIQFFDIGTDIVDFSVEHSANQHWSYISYILIDPSNVSVKVYDEREDTVVRTIREGMEISGQCFYVWDGSNDAGQMVETGEYYIKIYDTSSYYSLETGEPTYSIMKKSDDFLHRENPYTNYIPGDVNNSGIVDIGDAVYLINYVFKGGPEPEPYMCVGDVTADGSVNVGDAVYLYNYVFGGAQSPLDGCQDWLE